MLSSLFRSGGSRTEQAPLPPICDHPVRIRESPVYHISKKGQLAICRAEPGECPLEDSPHGTPEEIEAQLEESYGLTPTVSKRRLPPSEPMPESWGEFEREFWRATEKKLGLLIYQGIPYALGDSSKSNYYCLDCNEQFPKSDDFKTPSWRKKCQQCGEVSEDGVAGHVLKPGDERFFEKEAVLESEWYHYTAHGADWEAFLEPGNPKAKLVHLGSKESALDRKSHTRLARSGSEELRLYRVRLKPGAVVAENILQDDPFNAKSAPLVSEGGVQKGILMGGVTRYLNAYEDPGSMSLMVNPELIEIVDMTELDQDS